MGLGRKANQVLFFQFLFSSSCFIVLLVFFPLFPDLILLSLCNFQVYIIDFGLAKRYRDATTNRHIPYRYKILN